MPLSKRVSRHAPYAADHRGVLERDGYRLAAGAVCASPHPALTGIGQDQGMAGGPRGPRLTKDRALTQQVVRRAWPYHIAIACPWASGPVRHIYSPRSNDPTRRRQKPRSPSFPVDRGKGPSGKQ